MSGFLATTTVVVLRGEEVDEYADAVDADTPVRGHVPVALSEGDKRVWVPAENRTTVVRQVTGRARPGSDIREGDRLRDERDQSIYLVEGVSRPQTPIGQADVRLTLRRVDDAPR